MTTTVFTVQQVLGAFLSSNGQHEAAAEALASNDRIVWLRLAELAIRTTPAWNKADCARAVKLAMDDPKIGGKGNAQDFIIRKEAHPFQEGQFVYRGYIDHSGGNVSSAGFVSPVLKDVYSRLVGAYVVRHLQLPEGETL